MSLLDKIKGKKEGAHTQTSGDGASGDAAVERFFESAMKYYQAGSLRNAEEKLRDILHIDPANIEAYYYLGLIFEQLIDDDEDFENIEEAIIAFREVVKAQPDNVDARVRLGMLNLKCAFYESALRELQEAVNIAPGSAQAHACLGEAFYTVALGKDVKIEHPTGVGATRDIKGSKEYFKQALEEFTKAVSLDKDISERLSKMISRAERNIK